MLSYEERKKKTGELGEKLVSRYYRFLGLSVEKTLDKYDNKITITIKVEREFISLSQNIYASCTKE